MNLQKLLAYCFLPVLACICPLSVTADEGADWEQEISRLELEIEALREENLRLLEEAAQLSELMLQADAVINRLLLNNMELEIIYEEAEIQETRLKANEQLIANNKKISSLEDKSYQWQDQIDDLDRQISMNSSSIEVKLRLLRQYSENAMREEINLE